MQVNDNSLNPYSVFPDNESINLCTICQEENDTVSKVMRCSHAFHAICIDTWIKTQSKDGKNDVLCPNCNTVVKEKEVQSNRPHTLQSLHPDADPINLRTERRWRWLTVDSFFLTLGISMCGASFGGFFLPLEAEKQFVLFAAALFIGFLFTGVGAYLCGMRERSYDEAFAV